MSPVPFDRLPPGERTGESLAGLLMFLVFVLLGLGVILHVFL